MSDKIFDKEIYEYNSLMGRVTRNWGLRAAALVLLFCAGPATAQDEEPLQIFFRDEASVSWVLVPTVVRDGSGLVDGLAAENFSLRVDRRPVAFESFERDVEAPVSLIFLQDLSGSMANSGKLEISREALGFLLDRSRPGDEFALASFASGRTHVEVPFTGDVEVLREARDLWRAWGTTALHDAVAWLPDLHTSGRNLKRAAVLVTDGVDNASTIAPEAARAMVSQARLPVYVFGLEAPLRPGGESEAFLYGELLRELAEVTGGRYFKIDGPDALPAALEALHGELRHQYVLGFRTGTGPEANHQLEVEVAGESLIVKHRRTYRGALPSEPAEPVQ